MQTIECIWGGSRCIISGWVWVGHKWWSCHPHRECRQEALQVWSGLLTSRWSRSALIYFLFSLAHVWKIEVHQKVKDKLLKYWYSFLAFLGSWCICRYSPGGGISIRWLQCMHLCIRADRNRKDFHYGGLSGESRCELPDSWRALQCGFSKAGSSQVWDFSQCYGGL